MSRTSRRRKQATQPRRPTKRRAQWRETLDSWGGLSVIGTLVIVVVVAAFFILRQPLGFAQSDDELLGDVYSDVGASHVADGSLTEMPSQPPAGGDHYPRPAPTGVFDEPLADGNLVHALEHGIIWFSYQPDLVTDEQLALLEDVAGEYSNDVILAPRPANNAPLYALSWGRRSTVDPGDVEFLRQFVETNRNRSPEPGVR